ncbi:hypothetical protein M0R19_04840 [Candidatus Pacearchaeota archaeon]|jgi:hypothetical protein|nr:hypothetical protein [Candidatus Pacearchaeota archaeon]
MKERALKKYYVVSPEHQYVAEYIDYWPRYEYGCDVLEIEAFTKREAKIEAVKIWRKDRDSYVYELLLDKRNPFVGLKVYDDV